MNGNQRSQKIEKSTARACQWEIFRRKVWQNCCSVRAFLPSQKETPGSPGASAVGHYFWSWRLYPGQSSLEANLAETSLFHLLLLPSMALCLGWSLAGEMSAIRLSPWVIWKSRKIINLAIEFFFFFLNKSLFKHLCPDLCASQFLICKQQNHKTSLFWSKLLWDLLPLPGSLKLTTTFWHCRVKGDLEDVLEQAIAWDALCEINTRIPLGLLFAFQISHSYHTLRRNSGSLKLRVFTNVREAWKGFTKLPPTRKRECQIISGNWHRALAPQSMLEFFLPHSYSSEQCLCASWHKTTYCVMNF